MEYRIVRQDMRGIFTMRQDRMSAVRSVLGLMGEMYMYYEEGKPMMIQARRSGISGNDSTWRDAPVTEQEMAQLKDEIEARRQRMEELKQARLSMERNKTWTSTNS